MKKHLSNENSSNIFHTNEIAEQDYNPDNNDSKVYPTRVNLVSVEEDHASILIKN